MERDKFYKAAFESSGEIFMAIFFTNSAFQGGVIWRTARCVAELNFELGLNLPPRHLCAAPLCYPTLKGGVILLGNRVRFFRFLFFVAEN